MAITNLKSEPEAEHGGMGHNRPPITVEAKANFDEMIDERPGFRKRIDDLIGAADRATATSEETLGKCGETVKQIRAAMKVVGDAHTAAKKPYWDAGKVIDAEKNSLQNRLEEAKSKIETKQKAYLRKVEEKRRARQAEIDRQERLAQEKRDRLQREHDEAVRKAEQEAASNNQPVEEIAPPPPPPAPPPAVEEKKIFRGSEGAAISGKKVWKSQIDDYTAAFPLLQSNQIVRDAMDKAAAALVRGGIREIPGARIWEDIAVSNR